MRDKNFFPRSREREDRKSCLYISSPIESSQFPTCSGAQAKISRGRDEVRRKRGEEKERGRGRQREEQGREQGGEEGEREGKGKR